MQIPPKNAVPGRDKPMALSTTQHAVLEHSILPPFPPHTEVAYFALGCFWGAERLYWKQIGVYTTAVGYAGGYTPNPTYEEVCTEYTGHAETVMVVFNPNQIHYQKLLTLFWEAHNPTEGMRQGNDIGTPYRSAIYFCNEAQKEQANLSYRHYNKKLQDHGHPPITTEIHPLNDFFYAESFHQQYLAKHPNGYCRMQGTGIPFET